MRGDFLAFLGFSHKGTVILFAVTSGAFFGALLVNVLPMRAAIRAIVLALGAVAAIAFVFARPYGEDRFAWAVIFGFGLLAWFFAFALAGIIRAAKRGRKTRFANLS